MKGFINIIEISNAKYFTYYKLPGNWNTEVWHGEKGREVYSRVQSIFTSVNLLT